MPAIHRRNLQSVGKSSKLKRRLPTGPEPGTVKYHSQEHKAFACALRSEMERYGDTIISLLAALDPTGGKRKYSCVKQWRLGHALPRHQKSFEFLRKIEHRYNVAEGHFEGLLFRKETAFRKAIKQVSPTDQAAFRWHIPHDFEERGSQEQAEIEAWIRKNILPGNTDYGKYQSGICQIRYAIVFPELHPRAGRRHATGYIAEKGRVKGFAGSYGTIKAPAKLAQEMAQFAEFRTALFPPSRYRRVRRWTVATSRQQGQRYGQIFGSLAASPMSAACGRGVPKEDLTFGLLAFPAVLDWYLQWRVRRRGFFTSSERSDLYEIKSACRYPTGWIRQHPEFARKLKPISGLISLREIAAAKRDWGKTCDRMYRHCADRLKEIQHVFRAHRDPFAAITPILDAKSPLGEYKKIADEILRRMPDVKRHPVQAATSVRSYLMVRFALHLGFRQRNLRELLFCPRGQSQRTTQALQNLRCGELRWNKAEQVWQVFLPAVAFKNGDSTYFKGRPHEATLPDLGKLYWWIEQYLTQHRAILLKHFADPGTFFVKETRTLTRSASYDIYAFYDAWQLIVQRYGIYNPYTGRGAIKGLLPHGPHSVRDVLATHVLKQTGSYELAGFAIQDTTAAVMKHYARFLPHEKAAKAAEVINRAWSNSRLD